MMTSVNDAERAKVLHLEMLLRDAKLARATDKQVRKVLLRKKYPAGIIGLYLGLRQKFKEAKRAEVPTSEREAAGAEGRGRADREEPRRSAGGDAGASAEP